MHDDYFTDNGGILFIDSRLNLNESEGAVDEFTKTFDQILMTGQINDY